MDPANEVDRTVGAWLLPGAEALLLGPHAATPRTISASTGTESLLSEFKGAILPMVVSGLPAAVLHHGIEVGLGLVPFAYRVSISRGFCALNVQLGSATRMASQKADVQRASRRRTSSQRDGGLTRIST